MNNLFSFLFESSNTPFIFEVIGIYFVAVLFFIYGYLIGKKEKNLGNFGNKYANKKNTKAVKPPIISEPKPNRIIL